MTPNARRLAREAAITGAAWGLALVALPWVAAILYLMGRAEEQDPR